MTGDTTPISDEAPRNHLAWLMWCYGQGYTNASDRAVLTFRPVDLAAGPTRLHSDDAQKFPQLLAMADEVLALITPLLVSAGSSAQAERLRRERDRWEDEAKGWERHLITAEVVVEGLRAELAERDAAITKLRATHADALAGRDAITRVIMRERDEARARSAPSTTDPNDERAAMIWGIVSRLTPVESDAQDACDEIEALIAPVTGLRAAGGQEKPNDALVPGEQPGDRDLVGEHG